MHNIMYIIVTYSKFHTKVVCRDRYSALRPHIVYHNNKICFLAYRFIINILFWLFSIFYLYILGWPVHWLTNFRTRMLGLLSVISKIWAIQATLNWVSEHRDQRSDYLRALDLIKHEIQLIETASYREGIKDPSLIKMYCLI